jgi:small subunit ribosomal protein S17
MSMGRKSLVGRVISTKMEKTVVVEVEYRRRHPLYHKVIRLRRRFMAHDEKSTCQEGDKVRIVETRPLSRLKRWRVVEVMVRAQ